MIGVAGPATQGARWRSSGFPLPPHPLSYASQTLGKGAKALGLDWQANSRAALSLPWNGRAPCNYCGGCNKGCPRGDKGSADVTFIAAALDTGRCTVRPECPAIRIEAGPDDHVAAVLVGRPDGSIERIASKQVVLACGAVETPRLLLASDGLANESGQVGQNFMDTLFVTVGALHPEPQHGRRGLPSDAISWDFNAPDAIPGVIGGCRLYNAAGESELGGLAAFALRAAPGWGRAHAQSVRKLWGHALHVGAIGERLPNRDSRVDLDPVARDAFAMPLARIASILADSDIARLRFMARKSYELLAASGAERIYENYSSWDWFVATHVFGTCRMGDDPASSVVDAFGRSHRWRNLWIADASVFPSSGGGEAPSLTIQALHRRLELDTIPKFNLGEKGRIIRGSELRSDRGTLFLPKLRPPQSAGSLFQSPPFFFGRIARLRAWPPSPVPMSESYRCNPAVTFPGHTLCRSDAWSGFDDVQRNRGGGSGNAGVLSRRV